MSNPQASSPGRRKLRMLLADGSSHVRDTLQEALENMPFVEIAGQASSCRETLDLFFRARPDVVVVAISLPDDSGFEVLRCVRQAATTCVVVLTTRWPDPFVEEAAGLLGAAGVCLTTNGFVQLRGLLQRECHLT